MKQMKTIKKRIACFVMILLIMAGLFSGMIPGMVIMAEAADSYTVLLWTPYTPSTETSGWVWGWKNRIKTAYESMSDTDVTVKTKEGDIDFTSSDLLGVDLIYILPSNGSKGDLMGTDKVNVALLRDFVEAGGRIVMNGEVPGFSTATNKGMSDLAKELGGDFKITDKGGGDTSVKLNPDAKTELSEGCENLSPRAYAVIEASGSAVWVMKGDPSGDVFVVDQDAGNGYITALADCNWLDSTSGPSKEAADRFLKNLLLDSAHNMDKTPAIITQPEDLVWYCGDDTPRSFSIYAESHNGGILTYQWYKGDSPDFELVDTNMIPGATGSVFSIPEPEKMAVGEYFYKCIVTNTKGTDVGKATSRAAKATVLEAVKPIIEGPNDLTWIYGDDSEEKLAIRATSPNGGTLSYQWYKGKTPDFIPDDENKVVGATGSEYPIPTPELVPVGVYYYKCIVTNTKGTVIADAISKAATVTVLEIPAPAIEGPNDLTWIHGDDTERVLFITATSPNRGALTYQWYRGDNADFTPDDSSKVVGATDARYSIPSPGTVPVGVYYYKCVVTNTKGTESASATSKAGTVTVLEIPVPTVNGPEDIIWYYGDHTERRMSVTATSPNGGTLTYQWYRGDAIDFVPSDENRLDGAIAADYSIHNPGTMDVGNYYYRCVVTNNKGTESASATSQTGTATVLPVPEGDVEVDVEKHANTPDTNVKNLTEDVAWENATDTEKNRIKHDGLNGRMWLEITNINNTVPANDKNLIENEVGSMDNTQVGIYLDFSMFFRVGDGEKRTIEKLKGKGIDIEVAIPDYLRSSEYKRYFYLVNVHDGIVKRLGSSTADVIPATLTEFSTYAILYMDEIPEPEPKKAERPTSVSPQEKVFKASVEIKQDKKKIIIRWGKMPNVAKVEVYATYCKTKYPAEPNVTSTSRKATLKKINGKKIDTKRTYKMCLVAYDSSGEIVGKTLDIHVAGKDVKENTNPKSIKLSKSKVTLAKGQGFKVKATVKLQDKKKKELDNTHCARFRYVSSDPEIAKVDKKGNITGVSPGTCEVYVVCRNGLSKKVIVTVTK